MMVFEPFQLSSVSVTNSLYALRTAGTLCFSRRVLWTNVSRGRVLGFNYWVWQYISANG